MEASVHEYTTTQAELIQFYDFYRSAVLGHRYNAHKLKWARRLSSWAEIIAAVTSSTAIATLAFWKSDFGANVFTGLLGASALASIARTAFGLSQEVDLRSRLSSSWLDLHLDMESAIAEVRRHGRITDVDRARLDLLSERFRKVNSVDPSASDERLLRKLQPGVNESIPHEMLWLPSE